MIVNRETRNTNHSGDNYRAKIDNTTRGLTFAQSSDWLLCRAGQVKAKGRHVMSPSHVNSFLVPFCLGRNVNCCLLPVFRLACLFNFAECGFIFG